MKAVYIHIPFCEKICNYCDFCKLYYNEKMVKSYLLSLKKEIMATYKGEPVRTLYIGGGTPSALSIDELKQLFDILKILDLSKLEEFTIECNVENITIEKLQLFKDNKVNRLSMGVQTFNQKLLKVLGRNHNDELVIGAVKATKSIGITNINIDFIYGIQGQTLEGLKHDVDMFLSLDVPHASFYSLIIEPHTRLYIDKFADIDEDLNESMYQYINKTLESHHYNHYEISNYARDGYESKHNLVYWRNEEYYGFGLGASSYINGVRYDNTRSLNHYLAGKYMLNKNILSDKEAMENEMILGLRLRNGVSKTHFYQKYHQDVSSIFPIDKLVQTGQLIDKDNFLYIPDDKVFISNSILMEFID